LHLPLDSPYTVESHIATLLKYVVDELGSRSLGNVMILASGLEDTLDLLRQDHPSAPGIFSVLDVPPMSIHEVEELFEVGLRGTGVAIRAEALALAAEYAAGSPDRAQAVAEQAYELAGDEGITVEVMREAIRAVRDTRVFPE
jgi:hypothetical protein